MTLSMVLINRGAGFGSSCPVISAPLAGKVLVMLPDGTSTTMDVDTLNGGQFTTAEAVALAEYERVRGH